MRNIGIFTHDLYPFKPWGQGRYVYDLTNHLRNNNWGNIFIFSPSDGINDDHHFQIFRGSHNTLGKNIIFSVKLGLVIEKIIKKNKISLVHFQGGPGGLFLFKKTSIPIIYTVHHTYYQQYRYIPSQQWKKILYLLEKFSYSKSDYIICDSPSTENIILRKYGVRQNICKTIPIGVDQNCFYPLGLQRIPNSLFFLGRLESRKGIDFLLKTIPMVKTVLKDILLFIGGNGVLRPYLERLIEEYQLEQNVHFLGTIEDSALNEWYNRVSAVIIPSVFEGFGLTVIEAMACGTPVIATDVDALRDVVKDDMNGFLVQYNDVKGLSEKILFLLRHEEKQSKFSNKGEEIVRTLYNWDNISKDILKIYEEVLSR